MIVTLMIMMSESLRMITKMILTLHTPLGQLFHHVDKMFTVILEQIVGHSKDAIWTKS